MRFDDECGCGLNPCECDIPEALKRKIGRAVKKLNALLEEARRYAPEAQWYLEDTANFHLMSGPSHSRGRARQDRVIAHYYLDRSGGGGW